MSEFVKIAFAPIGAPEDGALIVFVGEDFKPGPRSAAILGEAAGTVESAAKIVGFKGAALTVLDILQPAGLSAGRLLLIGYAPKKDDAPLDFASLGGFVFGKLGE